MQAIFDTAYWNQKNMKLEISTFLAEFLKYFKILRFVLCFVKVVNKKLVRVR